MVRAVVLCILLAGCGRLGFDATTTDDDVSSDEVDVTDQPDDDDVEPDDDTQPDDDDTMDGTIDASMACGTGHNEDGDLFTDECDRCPHIPTTANTDTDSDGVGDDCDPQPSQPNQSIARFDTFETLAGDWNTVGNAVAMSDQLVFGGTGSSSISRPWTNGTSLFIVGFTTNVLTGGAALLSLNAGESTSSRLYYCELYDDTFNMALQLTYTLNGMDYIHPGLQSTGQRLSGLTGTLEMNTASIKRCHVEYGGGFNTVGGTVNGIAPDTFALYAENVTATIDWMIEIRTTP